jgi:hypothetical protein
VQLALASPRFDHADQLSDEMMRVMREKRIFAVQTFAISEYFADHAPSPEQAERSPRPVRAGISQTACRWSADGVRIPPIWPWWRVCKEDGAALQVARRFGHRSSH